MADIPTIFEEGIDKSLEFKHSTWLNDIIIVTKGTVAQHELEVEETMEKLEEADTDYTRRNLQEGNRVGWTPN